MNLQNLKILVLSHYSAPFAGNFISSLDYLANELNEKFNTVSVFCFPKSAGDQDWMPDFQKKYKVHYVQDNLKYAHKKLDDIVAIENPDIIHTHFDGFDIPAVLASNKSKKRIQVVWHQHNTLTYQKNILKKIYQFIMFKKHYGFYSKGVAAIGVSQEVLDFTKRLNIYKYKYTEHIPNGIVVERLKEKVSRNDVFSFGIIAGRNSQKRIDILLSAAVQLNPDYNFKVVILKGVDTDKLISRMFPKQPSWIELVNPTSNISDFYTSLDCYVSTSIHETFSYAVGEATICGLPVIQSDIEGTSWNSGNPSVFLFESENVKELSERMIAVMNSDWSMLREKCEITRKNNIALYGIDVWVANVIDFYRKL